MNLQQTGNSDRERILSGWIGYAAVVVLEVALDAFLKLIHPYLPLGEYAIPYVLVIMLAAYLFGVGPAILALVIGFVGFDYYYTEPLYQFWPIAVTPRDWAGVATFFIGSIIVAISMILIRNAKSRTEQISAVLRDANERLNVLLSDLDEERKRTLQALEREKEFSVLLQRALLPGNPSVDAGYAVRVGYAPAYAGTEIGGDFYDVFSAGPGRTGILIGDVSGKGLQAASLAAATRSTIHALVHETQSPGLALCRSNSVLCCQFEEFVTAFLVVLDPASGQLNYSCAGHPPAVILRADGSVVFLEFGNLPLVITEPQSYTEFADRLETGDKIVLYTDGITESRSNGDMFDLEGIERALSGHGDWCADEVMNKLFDAAKDWADGKLRDDAAIVVVERKRPGHPDA